MPPKPHDDPHVVIVGGGFGGLYAAKVLGAARARVTVVDQRNFHLFQPLLYQVATGGLSPGDIASPIRSVLKRCRGMRVVHDEAVDVLPEERCVVLRGDGTAAGGEVTGRAAPRSSTRRASGNTSTASSCTTRTRGPRFKTERIGEAMSPGERPPVATW